MKKEVTLFGILMLVLLTACGASGGEGAAAAAQVSSGETAADGEALTILGENPSSDTTADDGAVITSGEVQSVGTESRVRLHEDYADALPVQTQLALGTLMLEESELAVDGGQAAALLPLWRAVQSLAESGTAADAEITAVLNQIQAGMTIEQIASITDMQLTQEAMRLLVQEGVIAIELGDVKRGSSDGATGGGPPGGGGGPLGGQIDPTQQAARQAEGGGNNLLNQAVTSAVVQLLELKTT